MTSGQKSWFVAGLVTLLAGSLLPRHCWRMLGKHFTGNVKAAADQPVIEQGVYRWVRHPSYTGEMLMCLGTGLALTNWLSFDHRDRWKRGLPPPRASGRTGPAGESGGSL